MLSFLLLPFPLPPRRLRFVSRLFPLLPPLLHSQLLLQRFGSLSGHPCWLVFAYHVCCAWSRLLFVFSLYLPLYVSPFVVDCACLIPFRSGLWEDNHTVAEILLHQSCSTLCSCSRSCVHEQGCARDAAAVGSSFFFSFSP